MTEPLSDDDLARMRAAVDGMAGFGAYMVRQLNPQTKAPPACRVTATDVTHDALIAFLGEAQPPWVAAVLDELTRLRAENAELVAARAELVEGLRAFGPPCDTEDWPDHAELIYEEGTNAERFICTLGSMRRAAELVARHGGQE